MLLWMTEPCVLLHGCSEPLGELTQPAQEGGPCLRLSGPHWSSLSEK